MTTSGLQSMTPSTPSEPSGPWTTRRLLAWIHPHLEGRGVEAPRVVAEMLLAHVFGCDRMRLYMEVDRPSSPEELQRLRGLVARAANHEPVHYLIGEASFFWRQYRVSESTLIPQPCTEVLVEHVSTGPAGRAPRSPRPSRMTSPRPKPKPKPTRRRSPSRPTHRRCTWPIWGRAAGASRCRSRRRSRRPA